MGKTIVAYGDNQSVEVETNGNLWGFKSDDIITRDKIFEDFFCWKNKKVRVEGFRDIELWGTVEGEKISTWTSNSSGLILLKRSELKFEVGDDEIVAISGRAEEKTGKIIVIDPYYPELFLVQFKNFVHGHNGPSNLWKKPWYPSQHQNDSCSRLWVAGSDLKFLSKAD